MNSVGRRANGELVEYSAVASHITREFYDMAADLNKKYTCPICLVFVERDNIEITLCGHIYCKPCLDEVKKHSHECSVCRQKF